MHADLRWVVHEMYLQGPEEDSRSPEAGVIGRYWALGTKFRSLAKEVHHLNCGVLSLAPDFLNSAHVMAGVGGGKRGRGEHKVYIKKGKKRHSLLTASTISSPSGHSDLSNTLFC